MENNKKKILYLLILLPFFKPDGIKNFTIINSIFLVMKFISLSLVVYIIVKYLIQKKRNIFNNGFWGLTIFWGIYLINNIKKGYFDSSILNYSIFTLSLMLLFAIADNKEETFYLSFGLHKIFIVWFWIQSISMILGLFGIAIFGRFTNGDLSYYLGPDNYSAFMMIPIMCFIIYYNIHYRSIEITDIKNISYILINTILNLLVKSYTAFFGALILLIVIESLKVNKKIFKMVTFKNIFIFGAIFLVFVIVFKIQNYFSWLLVDIMGKSVSLSSRTIIWDDAIGIIKNNLLFGVGSFTPHEISSYVLYGTTHTHNIILELILRTGILGTLGYLTYLFYPLKKEKNNNSELAIFYACIGVLFIMDFYVDIIYLYVLVNAMYYFPKKPVIENEDE